MKTNQTTADKEQALPDFLTTPAGKDFIQRARTENRQTPDNDAPDKTTQTPDSQTEALVQVLNMAIRELAKRGGNGFNISGDVTNSNIVGNNSDTMINYRSGTGEKALNELNAVLKRLCDILERKLDIMSK